MGADRQTTKIRSVRNSTKKGGRKTPALRVVPEETPSEAGPSSAGSSSAVTPSGDQIRSLLGPFAHRDYLSSFTEARQGIVLGLLGPSARTTCPGVSCHLCDQQFSGENPVHQWLDHCEATHKKNYRSTRIPCPFPSCRDNTNRTPAHFCEHFGLHGFCTGCCQALSGGDRMKDFKNRHNLRKRCHPEAKLILYWRPVPRLIGDQVVAELEPSRLDNPEQVPDHPIFSPSLPASCDLDIWSWDGRTPACQIENPYPQYWYRNSDSEDAGWREFAYGHAEFPDDAKVKYEHKWPEWTPFQPTPERKEYWRSLGVEDEDMADTQAVAEASNEAKAEDEAVADVEAVAEVPVVAKAPAVKDPWISSLEAWDSIKRAQSYLND